MTEQYDPGLREAPSKGHVTYEVPAAHEPAIAVEQAIAKVDAWGPEQNFGACEIKDAAV